MEGVLENKLLGRVMAADPPNRREEAGFTSRNPLVLLISPLIPKVVSTSVRFPAIAIELPPTIKFPLVRVRVSFTLASVYNSTPFELFIINLSKVVIAVP